MGATDFLMTQRRVKEAPPTISDPNTITVAATLVADRRFWRHLQNLRELKSFLTSEGVTFSDEDLEATQLGELDILSFSRSGRIPSADEWRQIDTKTNRLTRYLSYCLRRKLHLFRLRMYFRILPIIFIVFAIMALILNATTRYAITDKNGGLTVMGGLLDFLSNIFWILALGELGRVVNYFEDCT